MEGTVGIALQSRATYQEGRYCIHFDKNFVFAIFKQTVGVTVYGPTPIPTDWSTAAIRRGGAKALLVPDNTYPYLICILYCV